MGVIRKQGLRNMDVDQVVMTKTDGSTMHFKEPKTFLTPKGNTFVIQGKPEIKPPAAGGDISKMLAGLGGGRGGQPDLASMLAGGGAAAGGLGSGVDTFDTGDDDDDDDDDGVEEVKGEKDGEAPKKDGEGEAEKDAGAAADVDETD